MTSVAILNSRQSKTPAGKDPWVRATLVAVEYAAANGWTIISSIGLNTWELVSWAAGRHDARQVLICPDDPSGTDYGDLIRRFNLKSELVEWRSITRSSGRSQRKKWWAGRDCEIVEAAEILLPVSIRQGGNLDSLLSTHSTKSVDDRFRIAYKPITHHERDAVVDSELNPDLHDWSDRWLIHWTRACHRPWPGESESDYYTDLVESGDEYCRSAGATLRRILSERLIRASSWKIGVGRPMVAFTELTPTESLRLMRWRPRWSRWSFEPYGIAITKEVAAGLGVRPVRYVPDCEWKTLSIDEKPLAHREGKADGFWTAEREWRCAGNVNLSLVPTSDLRVIVRSRREAAELFNSSPAQILPILEL